jgi:RNA recognition motif-containing protein
MRESLPFSPLCLQIWWGRRDPKNNSDFIGVSSALSTGIDQRNDLALSVFVGGLPRGDTEESLNDIKNLLWEVFAEYTPDDVNIIPGKGYGFIRMPSAQYALNAIKAIHGFEVVDEDDPNKHYKLVVSHARSRGV